MHWKSKLLHFLDVTLRVPPLIVMDLILSKTFMMFLTPYEENSMPAAILGIVLFVILFCFIASVVIFTLSTKHICDTYCFLITLVVLWFSYWLNKMMVAHIIEKNQVGEKNLDNYEIVICSIVGILQVVLAFTYNLFRLDLPYSRTFLYSINYYSLLQVLRTASYLAFLQPVIALYLSLPVIYVHHSPWIGLMVGIELCLYAVFKSFPVMHLFMQAYTTSRNIIRLYGIQTFFETHWIRLHVPNVLRIFFLIRTLYSLSYLLANRIYANVQLGNTTYLSLDDGRDVSKQFLVSSCETTVALMGMTSAIAYTTHYFGLVISTFVGSENDEDRNLGTVSAVLFFILALQTGLTALDTNLRLVRLYRNFCLLLTAILHFVHGMVHPLLMTMSASRSQNTGRHARVLLVCVSLVVVPVWFLFYLWCQHELSTWLLAVTAFSVEVIVKVVISLLIYSLFMVDARRDTFWEKLDDYVYYIKSTGNTIEFLFGIFLFANGAYIMLFESGGTIRAVMMCVHAYFNIWKQAQNGWKTFIKRRTAVAKINSLPEANHEQLDAHNDVCAICYQELRSARITKCLHYFHGVCLRKWLYVQDKCPLCHTLVN